jgi:PIN domain nuclease of toxin-antitoxin system
MTKYVLDASSLIRYIDNEAGASRMEEILAECVAGRASVCISAVQWGEVASNLRKRMGVSHERRILSGLLPTEAEIVQVRAEHAVRAGDLRVDQKMSYADAFALDLAMQSKKHVLVTADYGFKTVDNLARIEFLPAK